MRYVIKLTTGVAREEILAWVVENIASNRASEWRENGHPGFRDWSHIFVCSDKADAAKLVMCWGGEVTEIFDQSLVWCRYCDSALLRWGIPVQLHCFCGRTQVTFDEFGVASNTTGLVMDLDLLTAETAFDRGEAGFFVPFRPGQREVSSQGPIGLNATGRQGRGEAGSDSVPPDTVEPII